MKMKWYQRLRKRFVVSGLVAVLLGVAGVSLPPAQVAVVTDVVIGVIQAVGGDDDETKSQD